MTKVKSIVSIVACALCADLANAAIMSNEERTAQLEVVRELLANEVRPVGEEELAGIVNPFSADRGVEVMKEEEVVAEVLTDEELLSALSEYINPTGIFLFGGEFYLIFKEKKMKVGSKVGVVYNGVEYGVTIAEITGSTYTIKRGDSELQLKLK